MSPRRPLALVALGFLVLAGLGLRDWPVEARKASSFADRALAPYGLTLVTGGKATLRLLPLPQVTLTDVRVSDATGPVLVEGRTLVADLDLWGLAAGRPSVSGLRIDSARIAPEPAAWVGPLRRLREGIGGGANPPHLALTSARIGDDGQARDLDLDLSWPMWSGTLSLTASVTWRGVPTRLALTRLRAGDLLGNHRSPFAAEVVWPGGSLVFDGTALLPAELAGSPSLSGQARFETGSLPQTLAWIGHGAPLAPLSGAFSLEGTFETQGRAISWPVLRVGAGGAVMEGAGAIILGSGEVPRLSVQATLAADRLDLAPLAGGLVKVFEDGTTPVALGPLSGGDLDLRMSASEGQVGPLAVADLAASVLVRDSSLEVALNRARLKGGVIKGRLTLAKGADPSETDMKVLGGFDRIDLGGLMSDLGASRWVTGPLQGQFSLESHGRHAAGLIAGLAGRANVAIEGGSLSGLDLSDVIHRNGGIAPGALARRNGRTGFERAAIALRFTDGIGEIAEADLHGAGVAATLRGQVSLPEERLDVVALLTPRQGAEGSRPVRIVIAGPWDSLTAQAQRADLDEPAGHLSPEARIPGLLQIPASIGLPGNSRAYAP